MTKCKGIEIILSQKLMQTFQRTYCIISIDIYLGDEKNQYKVVYWSRYNVFKYILSN